MPSPRLPGGPWFERRRTALSGRTRVLVGVAAAAVVPLAVAAILVPARSQVPNATIALVLAAVVVVLASAGRRSGAVIAAISAGFGFDVFHTRPYGSLAITRTQDIQTTCLLAVVGLVVGQLAARNRRHRDRAAGVSFDLGRIHAVAEMVAEGEPVDQVVLAVANELSGLLPLRSCRFDPTFATRPGPFVERHGALTWGDLHWGFATMGLPSKEVSLVVQHQGLPLGRYVMVAEPGVPVEADQLRAAVALADQAGAALAAQGIPGSASSRP